MVDSEKVKKFGTDKIVLLGLFAISLLIARIIVSAKTSVALSKPVELARSGLSIRLPDKNGWQREKSWEYRRNTFVLSSFFNPGIARVSANIQCIYLLAADRSSPQDWLEQRISRFEVENTRTGTTRVEQLTFDWMYLTEKSSLANMLIATAQLPAGRWLDIEIIETAGEPELVTQVFEKVVANIKFEGNELLQAGRRVIERIKDKGLTETLPNQGSQLFFVVKNAADQNIGFAMDHIDQALASDTNSIEGHGFFYIRTRRKREEASVFRCDNKLSRLSWQSQTRIGSMRSGLELNLSQPDLLTVTELPGGGTQRQYSLNPAAVPYAVIEAVFNQTIIDGLKEIMVDIIYNDGRVKPVVLSIAEPGRSSDAALVVKLQQLGRDRVNEEFHLDNKMSITKRLIRQDGIYVMQRSTLEELVRIFPERADDLLQRSKALKDNEKDSI